MAFTGYGWGFQGCIKNPHYVWQEYNGFEYAVNHCSMIVVDSYTGGGSVLMRQDVCINSTTPCSPWIDSTTPCSSWIDSGFKIKTCLLPKENHFDFNFRKWKPLKLFRLCSFSVVQMWFAWSHHQHRVILLCIAEHLMSAKRAMLKWFVWWKYRRAEYFRGNDSKSSQSKEESI